MDYESRRNLMRRLVLYSPQLSRIMLAGEFRSAFKGRGIDFDGLREYDITDDALRIDWNATIRHGHPFVKTYIDDRGLSVYILVDRSASMYFGRARSKYDTASLSAALLAHACLLNNVQVGGLLFGQPDESCPSAYEAFSQSAAPAEIRRFIKAILSGSGRLAADGVRSDPAASGRRQAEPQSRLLDLPGRLRSPAVGTPLPEALKMTASVLKKQTMVFIFSDFLVKDYARPLALLAHRHDVVSVLVKDQLDEGLPRKPLLVRAADAESGRPVLCAPGSAEYRSQWAAEARNRRLEWLSAVRSGRLPVLELSGDCDPAFELIRYFERRRGGRNV